jgi:hypothetical protein
MDFLQRVECWRFTIVLRVLRFQEAPLQGTRQEINVRFNKHSLVASGNKLEFRFPGEEARPTHLWITCGLRPETAANQ